jgi:hypothetical protein
VAALCHTVALMICVIFLVRLAVMNEGGERRGGEDNRNGGEGANTRARMNAYY